MSAATYAVRAAHAVLLGKPGPFHGCGSDSYGNPYSCVWDGHRWVSDGSTGFGDPNSGGGGMLVLFVIGVVIASIVIAVKVSAARSMARDAGMSPGTATAMTLLTEDGLAATYLASSLRQPPATAPAPAPAAPAATPARPVADRLRELDDLLDDGVITPEEHGQRRRAILDTL